MTNGQEGNSEFALNKHHTTLDLTPAGICFIVQAADIAILLLDPRTFYNPLS